MIKFMFRRIRLNFKRLRMFFFAGVILLAVLATILSYIYPGPESVQIFLDIPVIQALIGVNNIQNPGMLIWILLLLGSFVMVNFYPIFGIFLGVNVLPFNENEGKELIFSTDKSLLRYFLENTVMITILIPIMIVPAYLITAGFLLSTGGSGDINTLTISYVIPIFFIYVVCAFTILGSAIKSSPKTGYIFGGLFFIVSFTLNLISAEIENIKEINFLNDINLMHQVSANFQYALQGKWNEEFIVNSILLSIAFVILAVFFLYRVDYIQTRSSERSRIISKIRSKLPNMSSSRVGSILSKIRSKIPNMSSSRVDSILSKIRSKIPNLSYSRVDSILSKIGWKYPAFRDQLKSTIGIFLIYLVVTSLLQALIAQSYPGDIEMSILFASMTSILDSPIFAAFTFGHPLSSSFGGFIVLKFFIMHWIFYGPFLFIMSYNILMRDKSAHYDEITWSMPRTRSRVIVERTIAVLLNLWIIIFVNFVTLNVSQVILSSYKDIVLIEFTTTALTYFFLGIGYSIFLILFIGVALIPRSKNVMILLSAVFLTALLIPMIWYLNQDLSWILYFSPFYYIDVGGVILNDILIDKVILETLAYGVIIVAFYLIVVKFWTPRRDIV